MANNKKAWINRHRSDPYVRAAKQQGYRSRAAFKLLDIQQKYKLLRRQMQVIDLGAAPGSWSQVVQQIVGHNGRVCALDRLTMAPMQGVYCIQGDCQTQESHVKLDNWMNASLVDVVLSDMAPNLTGIAITDAARALALAEIAYQVVSKRLSPGGHFIVKVFQGEAIKDFYRQLQAQFQTVVRYKPKSSRANSKELYLLAQRYRK